MPALTLIIIVGPTGVGKTQASLAIASHFQCDVISADSRQLYRHMSIGTASPTAEELSVVPHHFVQILSPDAPYNASNYETDVLELLPDLFQKNPVQVMVGGSMMYIDAICKGIDDIPDVDPEVRDQLKLQLELEGIESLRLQLKVLDPVTYDKVDLKNPARVLHAVEVCLTTGKAYSSFLKKTPKKRPFNIVKVGIDMPREKLYQRINNRVVKMMEEGLEDEVKKLMPFRHCNALNTVGYKEMFAYLDGKIKLPRAIDLIQRNSRRYAKKQLTWFRKDSNTQWFSPSNEAEIFSYLKKVI